MLKIILHDGTELINNPDIGMNLICKKDIEECLNEVGYYDYYSVETTWKRIYENEIKEIHPLSAIDV